MWRTVNLKAIQPFLDLQPKARNWYASAKWLPNFVELLLGNSQIHSLFYSSWQIFSFFCTTKFLYLKAHISVVYLKNVILPMKTAAALPKMWWLNCSTYGYGEIEYYYEYCQPKANKKGEKNRTGHFAWLRRGQRGRLSRNIVFQEILSTVRRFTTSTSIFVVAPTSNLFSCCLTCLSNPGALREDINHF